MKVVKAGVPALAGLAGLLAVLWVIASALLGWQLMVFRTGSMAPSMPTGAVALTVPVAPADIHVGDVITVRRTGAALPVTHRVVSVAALPGHPAARSIVLKGDANSSADIVPYDVTTASRVVVAAPGAGAAIEATRSPLFRERRRSSSRAW